MTEFYIEHKGILYDNYEWAYGAEIKEKVNKARHKLVDKGQAKIVPESFFASKEKKKVQRK